MVCQLLSEMTALTTRCWLRSPLHATGEILQQTVRDRARLDVAATAPVWRPIVGHECGLIASTNALDTAFDFLVLQVPVEDRFT